MRLICKSVFFSSWLSRLATAPAALCFLAGCHASLAQEASSSAISDAVPYISEGRFGAKVCPVYCYDDEGLGCNGFAVLGFAGGGDQNAEVQIFCPGKPSAVASVGVSSKIDAPNFLSRVGDVNGDGWEDFLVSGRTAVLVDGRDGVVLGDLLAALVGEITGVGEFQAVRAIASGDVNADGNQDYVLVISYASGGGRVATIAGGTTKLIKHVQVPDVTGWFGWSVVAGRDVDGDHVPDVVIADLRGNVPYVDVGSEPGGLFAFSGSDLRLIGSLDSSNVNVCFGYSMAFVGDCDGDGHEDVAVGAPEQSASFVDNPVGGSVAIVSLLGMRVVHRIEWSSGDCFYNGRFGSSLASSPRSGTKGGGSLLIGADNDRLGDGAVYRSGLNGGQVDLLIRGLSGEGLGHQISLSDDDRCDSRFIVVSSLRPIEELLPGRIGLYAYDGGAFFGEWTEGGYVSER